MWPLPNCFCNLLLELGRQRLLPISIFTDIPEPKILAILIPMFFTAALFGLLTLEDVEKSFFALHSGRQTMSSV